MSCNCLLYNYFSCFYHACKKHFPDDDQIVLGGRTASKIRERCKKREDEIRELGRVGGFELKIVWECEINAELKHNEEMRKFFDACFSGGAIKLRDGLSGGRTEVFQMMASADEYYDLGFVDVVSLYPCKLLRYVNLNIVLFILAQMFMNSFPTSTPKCKIFNKDVYWLSSDDIKRFKDKEYLNGVIKCLILPPREEYRQSIPAIPMHVKDDERLLFPYCRSCCENKTGKVSNDPVDLICPHNDWQDRAWVATIPRPELDLALDEVLMNLRQLITVEFRVTLSTSCTEATILIIGNQNSSKITSKSFSKSSKKVADGLPTVFTQSTMISYLIQMIRISVKKTVN